MRGLALVLCCLAGAAAAAPETSLRPEGRAETISRAPSQLPGAGRQAAQDSAGDRGTRITMSLRPEMRPASIRKRAKWRLELQRKGAVCDNPDVLGEVVGRVTSQVKGCGIKEAVRVRSVSGVSLSPAALMDCQTALTLNDWVARSAVPRLRNTGGGLSSLRVIGHYSCRTRNNRPGGRISEHGKGRAIDISEFRLRDGSAISLLKDWNTKRGFQPLREMHRDACGVFGTVLGPKADRFHQDHFHFDTARHRNGSYCR